ncbi:uncharacterized protein [Salminus brasiliensis]|uniref:uncharacterized protein isoform X2 n=1 Tax=Salminus brasiliensis TaxID=930266 RepID=UPI003B82EB3C
MKVRELGFSSVHIGILCLCVLASGFPLLMSFLLCIVLNGFSVHFAFIFCPNIALCLAFILWGVLHGFFAEAATCSALNLLRIVFLIWIASGFEIFKEIFQRVSERSAFTLAYAVISTLAYSGLFWQLYQESKNTEILIAVGFLLILMLLFYIWILIHEIFQRVSERSAFTLAYAVISTLAYSGLHVLGPSGPLTVELGGSLMLPCYVESPLPLEELEVEWKRTDSESLVHLFQDGESRPEAQSQAYSGRARFFTEEIKHGNFSLLLTDLTSKDAGVYSCTVYRQQETGQALVEIKDVERLIVTGSQVTGAYVGEVTTLSCSVDSHIPPEELEVSWKKVDQQIPVLIFQDGLIHQESTHERYINRVEFFGPEEILEGNFSLRLKDLQTEDEGLYICEVFYGQFSANTTMKVRELGFSSVHIGILCLCVLASGFPLLMSFLLCIVLNGFSVHFAFIFCPNIALCLAFILWGVLHGFFAEAATCSALNLLRIVFLIWIASGFEIFKEIFQRVSERSAFTLAYAVISTLAYSGLFWQLYQESKNTEILIAVGFLLILMLLFYIWILIHGFKKIQRGGLLNYILTEIINVGRGIILVFLYGRHTRLHVLCPSGPLTVELGGSLMLPCYVESPLPLEELEVEWKRTDSESLVHLFQDGESRPEAQSQAYSGRARFFTEEIKHGNFSLLLTDLTSKDAGVYSCTVYRQQETGQALVEIKDVERLIVTGSQVTGAYVGEVTTLSCSVDSHIPPEELEVSWKKVDQQIPVLIFQDGLIHQESTHERYINRVEFFGPEEILEGNFSLRLKDLQTEDEGLYICEVFYGQFSANTTMKVRELGFSSCHIGIFCLCVLASGFPLLMSFLLCIVLDGFSVHFAFIFCPNIALCLAFILWGVLHGFFAEAATCSALNLLRIVFLIWIASGFEIFKEIFQRVSERSAFTLAYAVISTLAYSGLFWQLYQESKNTEILIAVGFLLILMLLFYIWILVHGFKKIQRGGLLNYILTEIINVGRGIILVFLYGRHTNNFVMITLASLLLWISFCGLPYLSKRRQSSLVLIWMTVVLILEGLNASLSVYIHNVVLESDKEHIGLTCVTVYLYILTVILLFEYLCTFYESMSSDTQRSLESVFGLWVQDEGLSLVVMYFICAVGLPIVNAIALAVEVIVNATQRNRERTVEDLRVILVAFECAFFVCCFTQQTATFWRRNREELRGDLNKLCQNCQSKQPAENSVASRGEPPGETVALQPLKSNLI